MNRYLDPTNDVAFKKLFSNKIRLMDFLNAVLKLPAGSRINELEYIPTEQMPLFYGAKRSIFDLKVKDEAGRWYIIEMQRKVEKDYLNRVQLYGSYSYVAQVTEGMKHNDLLPVVVISIMGSKVFPDELPCINYHCFTEDSSNKQYLFSLTYVFIELGKYNPEKINDNTDQWLHLLKCAHQELEPPKEIDNSNILSAYYDLEQFRWSRDEHDAYFRSRLAQEAEEDALEAKYEKGLEKGLEEGMEKGMEKGRTEGIEIVARNLLSQGMDIENITKATGLSIDAIKKLKIQSN